MKRNTPLVDDAVRTWRKGPPSGGSLSDGARARILERVHAERGVPRLELENELFVSIRRLLITAAAPSLALALLLGYLALPSGPAGEAGPAPRLHADKQGDEVIFTIANGQRAHRVYKSSRPTGAERAVALTDGRFRDRLENGSDLVFYRID